MTFCQFGTKSFHQAGSFCIDGGIISYDAVHFFHISCSLDDQHRLKEICICKRYCCAVQALKVVEKDIVVESNPDVVEWADAIVFAIASPKVESDIIASAELIKTAIGKPVLDATNPINATWEMRWAEGTSAGALNSFSQAVNTVLPATLLF